MIPMKRPLAYITAPWSENEFENTENAAKYCRAVYDAGFSPVCPALFLPLFLRDEIPQEHKDGIDMAREHLRRARVLVVCGSIVDESVKNDIAVAERLRTVSYTHLAWSGTWWKRPVMPSGASPWEASSAPWATAAWPTTCAPCPC